MAIRKKAAASAKAVQAKPADRFFEKELAGDAAPSFATLRELYLATLAFFALEPWKTLSDSELIAVQDPVSSQRGFCCIMGALGEIFSLHVFLGTEGFRVFDAIQSRDPNVTEWMYGSAGSLTAEMVPRAELKPQDRELLRALDHPMKPGQLVPIFRAQRKGYLPWCVTEADAKLLTFCVKAATEMVLHLMPHADRKYWSRRKYLPLIAPTKNDGAFAIEMIPAPDLSKMVLEMPVWDAGRVNAIRAAAFPTQGVLEVDHFYTAASVGVKDQRKSCVGMALVVDAHSAAVLKPDISKPGASASSAMVEVLLGAIESTQTLPKEVHVRDRHKKTEMEPLAKALGFALKAASSMPAFDFAKQQLSQMLGYR